MTTITDKITGALDTLKCIQDPAGNNIYYYSLY